MLVVHDEVDGVREIRVRVPPPPAEDLLCRVVSRCAVLHCVGLPLRDFIFRSGQSLAHVSARSFKTSFVRIGFSRGLRHWMS